MKRRTLLWLLALLLMAISLSAMASGEESEYHIEIDQGGQFEVPAWVELYQTIGKAWVVDSTGQPNQEHIGWDFERISGTCQIDFTVHWSDIEMLIIDTGGPGTSVFRLTAYRPSGESISAEFTVTVVDYVYPTGVAYEGGVISIKAGQTTTIRPPALMPAGSRLHHQTSFTYNCPYEDLYQLIQSGKASININTQGEMTVRCDVPGTYEFIVHMSWYDGRTQQIVFVHSANHILRVSDATGTVPPPTLVVHAERDSYNDVYDPIALTRSVWLCDFTCFLYGGSTAQTVWTVEQTSGRTINAYMEYLKAEYNVAAQLRISDRVTPGTYTFKVTATRGQSSASTVFTYYVKTLPANLPSGIVYDIGKSIVIKPGERYTLPAPSLKPANATMSDVGKYTFDVEKSNTSPSLDITKDEANGRHTFRANGPGVYNISVYAVVEEVRAIPGQWFTLIVSNTPDDLSGLLTQLRMPPISIIISPLDKPGIDLNYLNISGDRIPLDAQFEYTIEHIDGVDCLDFNIFTLNNQQDAIRLVLKKVKARGTGYYRLTATCKKYNLTCSTTIEVLFLSDSGTVEVPATGLTLSKSSASVDPNKRVKLSVKKFKPARVSKKLKNVVWESDLPEIATVDQNGWVTGVAPGRVMIRAYAVNANGEKNPDVYATCMITVRPPKIERLSFTQPALTLKQGDSYDLGTLLAIEPINGSGSVNWKSAKPKIAKVSSGVVTAKKPGTVKITAFVKGRPKAKATLTLTVVPPPSEAPEP